MGGPKNIFLLGPKKFVVKTFVLLKYFLGMICFWVCIQPGFAEDRTRLNLLKSWVKVG